MSGHMTNAQAALLAAAGQFSDAEVDINPDTVTGIAARYKGWLDRKDRETAAAEAVESAAKLQRTVFSRGGVDPEPPTPSPQPLQVSCPVCHAAPGYPCDGVTGGRTHMSRMDKAIAEFGKL